jgi:DNA-binding transcriptional regulator YhcF (GntR family)
MLISLDRSSAEPLYLQIKNSLKVMIEKGTCRRAIVSRRNASWQRAWGLTAQRF